MTPVYALREAVGPDEIGVRSTSGARRLLPGLELRHTMAGGLLERVRSEETFPWAPSSGCPGRIV
jgi:hypothetical protein